MERLSNGEAGEGGEEELKRQSIDKVFVLSVLVPVVSNPDVSYLSLSCYFFSLSCNILSLPVPCRRWMTC